MSTIKNSNSRDLVDAEEIKKRWNVHMEELYEKDPNEPDYIRLWSVIQGQTFWSGKSRGPRKYYC